MLSGDSEDPMAELEKTLSAEQKMDEAGGAAADEQSDGPDGPATA
jgi:hypothetical protein